MSPLCKEQKARKKLVHEEPRFSEMSSGMQGGLEGLMERRGPLGSPGFHTGLGIQFLAEHWRLPLEVLVQSLASS